MTGDLARCDHEIKQLKELARSGHPDVQGIMDGLSDWQNEKRMIYRMIYQGFLDAKRISVKPAGFNPTRPINEKLFDFQRDIVNWAIRKGKAAIFADCGLGKTAQELEFSAHVVEHTGRPVINFAPLAVSQQTEREGQKFGIPVTIAREQSDRRAEISPPPKAPASLRCSAEGHFRPILFYDMLRLSGTLS